MRDLLLKVSLGAMIASVAGLGVVQSQEAEPDSYPAPSFPNMKAPESVEAVMPFARAAARNENAFLGYGFGVAESGDKIILVRNTTDPSGDMYIEALTRALKERGVEAIVMYEAEIAGLSLDDAKALDAHLKQMGGGGGIFGAPDSSTGWIEGCRHFSLNDFLEKTRSDLYEKCNPPNLEEQLPPDLLEAYTKLRRAAATSAIPNYLNDYMDDHPGVKGVFYGRGGPVWEDFHPHKERWLGLMRWDNMWEAMAPTNEFPADVWMASEELSMEPMASTDKVTVTDPEGTNVWWDMTEEQAQRWARGVYLRGHLFIFPQEAYGGYGLNVLNYPSNVPDYIPVAPIVKLNGTVVSHTSHAGFLPKMEQIWEDGYLQEVRGGGTYGELLRTLMKMPGMNEKTWPHYPEPGYFWHYETALGTNPKALRPDVTRQVIASERERDGIIHWALGAQVWHDPGVLTTPAPSLVEFEKEHKLPATYHGFHLHTYFNTIKLRIRGTDNWVTIVDKGRSTSLDSPEVRALASRYGNPDQVLSTEWVPEVPGVNVRGNYERFAEDPFSYNKGVQERISKGEYTYNPDVRPASQGQD